jgi:transposase
MGQITVFSGPERRRRWTDEERLSILTEAFSSGACVADVARRRDVCKRRRNAALLPALE